MSRDPIRDAYEYIDITPSPLFRDTLRDRFLADVSKVSVSTATARGGEIEDRDEPVMITTEAPSQPKSRRKVVLGIAAALVLVIGLGVVLFNNRSQSTSVDTSRDPTIAREALVKVAELGPSFEVINGGLTSKAVADIAATVPECAPYLDAAFDGPGRRSTTTSGRIFGSFATTITEWVYLFPSEEAASNAMDKIAEPGFVPCFTKNWKKLIESFAPGAKVTPVAVATPSIAEHGDRQVAVTLHVTDEVGSVTTTHTVVSAFIQVGRGIVYIDPEIDQHDPTDPAGSVERALSLATENLDRALTAKPKG